MILKITFSHKIYLFAIQFFFYYDNVFDTHKRKLHSQMYDSIRSSTSVAVNMNGFNFPRRPIPLEVHVKDSLTNNALSFYG